MTTSNILKNIDTLIIEMDNPFNMLSNKFYILQALKTAGFAVIPFAPVISLHNCYKRTFNTPIDTKIIGFGTYVATMAYSIIHPITLTMFAFILGPLVYLLCLQSSIDETTEHTKTANLFKKLALLYRQDLPKSLKMELDNIDEKYKSIFKVLSMRYSKLSDVTDDDHKKQVIRDYGKVVFDGFIERINIFKQYQNELLPIQNELVNELEKEYKISKSEFFQQL